MENSRREFIKGLGWSAAASLAAGCTGAKGLGLTSGGNLCDFAVAPMKRVRIGVLGLGRGAGLAQSMSQIPGAEITAICDINPVRLNGCRDALVRLGKRPPALYGADGDGEAWKRLCDRDDVDVVYSVLPRELHGEVNVFALNAGKHVMQEVPGAYTLDECWATVEAAEKNRRHCMMLENCCYGEVELLALNLAKKGMLGTIMQAETEYTHDQRRTQFKPRDGKFWRIDRHMKRHGNYYPTHGMVPMTKCMDVNRGDRFDYLVSMESASQSFEDYAREEFPPGDPRHDWKMTKGDINMTMIRTVKGRQVVVKHNVATPCPYSRGDMLIGTRGIFRAYPELAIAFERRMDDGNGHSYFDKERLAEVREKYMHPLWRKGGELAKKAGGHGGMDFLMNLRWIYCLQQGLPLDTNVYDLATWSSVVELSERSVLGGSCPVDVPDFTLGGWKTQKPFEIVEIDMSKMDFGSGGVKESVNV